MNLAGDRRGRVPFALLAVLLLVGATVVVFVQPEPATVERASGDAADRAVASAETTMRDAAREAGTTAASAPVTEPAAEEFGAVLDVDRPFQSYLELLVYAETAERVDGQTTSIGETTATTEIVPVTDIQTASKAINRTDVNPAGTGLITVTIDGIDLRVAADNRTTRTETITLETTIPSPVLTMHERVQAFEDQLNTGPTDGLGAELTGRLYALAWARGYAQYAGAPVGDVLGHDHVELATASGAIDLQRSVFGTADPKAKEALMTAGLDTAADELLPSRWAGLAQAALPDPNTEEHEKIDGPTSETQEVQVGLAADQAFKHMYAGDDSIIEATLKEAYTIDARLAANTEQKHVETVGTEQPPGEGWTELEREATTSVQSVDYGTAEVPDTDGDWQLLDEFERDVTINRTIEITWVDGDRQTTTQVKRYKTHTVGIGIYGSANDLSAAPDREIIDLDRPGSPPAGVTAPTAGEVVQSTLLAERGGVESIAEQAVVDSINPLPETVIIEPPDAVTAWAYDELADLREEVRQLSTTVESQNLAGGSSPTKQLHESLADRKDQFVDAPEVYQSRAQQGLVGLRAAYVENVLEQLDTDTEETNSVQEALSEQIDRFVSTTETSVQELIEQGMEHQRPQPANIEAKPPATEFTLDVQTAPRYPSSDGVELQTPRTDDERQYPLAIRTGTVASLPADRIVEALADRLLTSDEHVPPHIAAHALAGANELPADLRPPAIDDDAAALREALDDVVVTIKRDSQQALATSTDLSYVQRQQVIETGLNEWSTTAQTVLAIHRGDAAESIARVVNETTDDKTAADRAATSLRVAIAESLEKETVAIPEGPVTDVIEHTRSATKDLAEDAIEEGAERVKERIDERLDGGLSMTPAGVPILPKPGAWWATANAWTVEIEGEYAAFSLRSPDGGPVVGGHTTYLRNGESVALDITGDGTDEQLGTNERISYETWSTVVVVVPAGGSGIGNTDTDGVECSDGWDGGCLPGE